MDPKADPPGEYQYQQAPVAMQGGYQQQPPAAQYQDYNPNPPGVVGQPPQYQQPYQTVQQPLLSGDMEIDRTQTATIMILILGCLFLVPFFHILSFLTGLIGYAIIRSGTTHEKTIKLANVLLIEGFVHLVFFILIMVFFPVTFPIIGALFVFLPFVIICCPCILLICIISCISSCANNSSSSSSDSS